MGYLQASHMLSGYYFFKKMRTDLQRSHDRNPQKKKFRFSLQISMDRAIFSSLLIGFWSNTM